MSATTFSDAETAPNKAAPAATSGQAGCAFSPSLFTLSEPNGERAESIRALRTDVMAQHIDRGRRALAVCAPNKGVGCTFVATNLAVSLSQIGVKTMLIDGDLHGSGVAGLIRPAASRAGLAGCLASETSFGDCMDAEILPNLSVMLAGRPVANSRELLAGDRFQLLMDSCLRDYDVTIVDTPPANSSSDVRRISTVLGYSLIVTGCNRTYFNDVKTLADQLRSDRAKVIGTVLNWA